MYQMIPGGTFVSNELDTLFMNKQKTAENKSPHEYFALPH
jgi:hypothetical protein